MKRRIAAICLGPALAFSLAAVAADDEELAKVKEQELEEVRERISELKQSMDRAAADRDRITGELQAAEIEISTKRLRLSELEREQAYVERRRGELEAAIETREAELETETGELGRQLRAAYMSGGQERVKLMLNQQDPATLGRLMTWYGYLNAYRGENIERVSSRIRELAALATELAAEQARLDAIAQERLAELTALSRAQDERQALLASLRAKIDTESQEIDRLAAEERDLARLNAELTRLLSYYPMTSEATFEVYKGRVSWPVAGTLMIDFGQARVGQALKWYGVGLAAPRGGLVGAV